MANFFEKLDLQDAERVDRLAKLAFELRENRAALLRRHGAADEAELLERIRSGAVAEHPAYEDYLGARILWETREALRAELGGLLTELNR
ncbi:MAG TPA: hypothetical protein VFP70_09125 [Burkholderiales bacterium]|nr:hypothetical protein [Burkholderiales bacterium]